MCNYYYFTIIYYRDIAQGEELLLSYGPAWEQAWVSYLDAMLEWHDTLALLEKLGRTAALQSLKMAPPQFRAAISAPSDFFPASFYGDECLGPIPCGGGQGMERETESRDEHGAEERAVLQEARAYATDHFSAADTDTDISAGNDAGDAGADTEEGVEGGGGAVRNAVKANKAKEDEL